MVTTNLSLYFPIKTMQRKIIMQQKTNKHFTASLFPHDLDYIRMCLLLHGSVCTEMNMKIKWRKVYFRFFFVIFVFFCLFVSYSILL